MDQKIYEKRPKIEFLDRKYIFFRNFSKRNWGVPPLTENYSAKKSLGELGPPLPLKGKVRLVVFDRLPNCNWKFQTSQF